LYPLYDGGKPLNTFPMDDVLQGLIVALALVKSSEAGKAVEINDFLSN